MELFLYYILAINLYGIFVMYADKKKSRKGKWRTPEKNIFIIAFAFGALGIFIGMRLFRHKTKHNKFVLGIPTILIIELMVIIGYVYKTM